MQEYERFADAFREDGLRRAAEGLQEWFDQAFITHLGHEEVDGPHGRREHFQLRMLPLEDGAEERIVNLWLVPPGDDAADIEGQGHFVPMTPERDREAVLFHWLRYLGCVHDNLMYLLCVGEPAPAGT